MFSPRGWVSSLAAESRNTTWQLPEETSPSTPWEDPAHEAWWCPHCCLGTENNTNKLQLAGQPQNLKISSITIRTTNLLLKRVVSPPACSISLMQNLAVLTAAGWWVSALSANKKSLPLRMAQTPCCAALRIWGEKVDTKQNGSTYNCFWGIPVKWMADLRLSVHCEAEQAVVSLKSWWVSPDRCVLLPQQSGQAWEDL